MVRVVEVVVACGGWGGGFEVGGGREGGGT